MNSSQASRMALESLKLGSVCVFSGFGGGGGGGGGEEAVFQVMILEELREGLSDLKP